MAGKDVDMPLNFSDWEREFGDSPPALLRNRIFENNPFQAKGNRFFARPGSTRLGQWGTGRIRKCWSLPGLFGGALFFVSGNNLYRLDPDGDVFLIEGIIYNDGDVSMAGVKGLDYERLFIADGSVLQFYDGGSKAQALVAIAAAPTAPPAGTQIQLGDTYYEWVTPGGLGEVPDGLGTSANPWKLPVGSDADDAIDKLVKAVDFDGTPGFDFSGNMGGRNTQIVVDPVEPAPYTSFYVQARFDDTDASNGLPVTEPSGGSVFNFPSPAELSGGGQHGLNGIEVPDGLPPLQVAVLKSFCLVSIGGSDRFYWVNPAAITIDPLDFATAESQPDDTVALEVIGDTAWFIGENSTEVWYATGEANLPFRPVNGRVYDRGAIPGTVVNIKGVIHLVSPDNIVYAIGGQPQRISNHGVEELIRLTIEAES